MDYLDKIKEFHKLTVRRQIYIRNLLQDPARNQARAARKSGYAEKSAHINASNIMKDELVKKVIKKYNEHIAADNYDMRIAITKELSLIAFSDVKTFLSWSNVNLTLKDSDKLPEGASRMVEEVSESLGAFGSSRKIKLHSKLTALKELNKMYGFYAPEKHEIDNPDGNMGGASIVILPANGREKK